MTSITTFSRVFNLTAQHYKPWNTLLSDCGHMVCGVGVACSGGSGRSKDTPYKFQKQSEYNYFFTCSRACFRVRGRVRECLSVDCILIRVNLGIFDRGEPRLLYT